MNGYVQVQRNSAEWDQMWAGLRDVFQCEFGDCWQEVFYAAQYMGRDMDGKGHCFRIKEVELPPPYGNVGRKYYVIPDGR